jgi:hypothetical protein
MTPTGQPLARLSQADLQTAYYQARRTRIHAKSLDDMSFAMKREAAIEKELETRAKVNNRRAL